MSSVSTTPSHDSNPRSKYTDVVPAVSTCWNVMVEPAGTGASPKSNTDSVLVP